MRLSRPKEIRVEPRVMFPHRRRVGRRVEPLAAVLANRLEQVISRLIDLLAHDNE